VSVQQLATNVDASKIRLAEQSKKVDELRPLASVSQEKNKEFEEEEAKLKKMALDLGNQEKSLGQAQMQAFEAGTQRLNEKATPLERWESDSAAVQNDIEAVRDGRAVAGPKFAGSNDLAGVERVPDQPGKWQFETTDPRYEKATYRTDDSNYVSNRVSPESGVKSGAWQSLEAQPHGSTSDYQAFQGGVTKEGLLREGTVRTGEAPHFSNGAGESGGFNVLADGKLNSARLEDGRVFQATREGRYTNADGSVINLGTYTSGGQTFERLPETYKPVSAGNEIVSETQLRTPRSPASPSPTAAQPTPAATFPAGVFEGASFKAGANLPSLPAGFEYVKSTVKSGCIALSCNVQTFYTVRKKQ